MSRKKDELDKPLHQNFPRCCVVFEPGEKVEVIYGHFKHDGFRRGPNWSARALYMVMLLICGGTLIYFRGEQKEIEHYAEHQDKVVAAAPPALSAEDVAKTPIWYPDKMEIHMPLDTGTRITIDGKNYERGGDGIWHYVKPKPVKKSDILMDTPAGRKPITGEAIIRTQTDGNLPSIPADFTGQGGGHDPDLQKKLLEQAPISPAEVCYGPKCGSGAVPEQQ